MIPKPLQSILWLFISVNIFSVIFYTRFSNFHADPNVFLIGNVYFFLITLLSYRFMLKGSKSTSTVQFTSALYGSFIMKLLCTALMVIFYSQWTGGNMNANSILGSLILYLLYLFLELKGLMSFFRKK